MKPGPQWQPLPKPKEEKPKGPPPATQEEVRALRDTVDQLQGQIASFKRDQEYRQDVLQMHKTWQESQADNVDSVSPLLLFVYIPPKTSEVHQVRLRLLLQPFRSYSKATKLSLESTLQTNTITGTVWELSSPTSADMMTSAPSHSHSGTTGAGGTDAHTHPFGTSSNGAHAHGLSRHSHYYTAPAHVHDNEPGIYTGLAPYAVSIKIDGVNQDAALGGPFTVNVDDLDIRQYLTTEGWHTVEFVSIANPTTNPNGLGRLYAVVFVDLYLPG